MWDRVTGQDRAVSLLQRAAERPVHSYLLAGPRGSGVEDAARCLAASLVGAADTRTWDLTLRGHHPDAVEVDPPESIIRVDHAQAVIDEAYRSPVEGERKVVILFDAERLNEPAANKLLKTIEEPPDRTVIVLVTEHPDELLPTIRSRCQRVDFGPLDEATVRGALEDDGVEEKRAALAARLAGGRLDRARALAGRLGPVRDAFAEATSGVDGTGASVAEQSETIQAALAGAVADLERAQERYADELAADLEASGYPERTAHALRRRLEEQQKRAHRRARTEALVEGITAIESVYRDALAAPSAPPLNADRRPLEVTARGCDRALLACSAARAALGEFNPNEGLLIEHLLFQLPAAASAAPQ